ncbi:MAG: 4-hydroxy-tetrahydrodipicolinate synthase [Paludibacteraceae bacterium]|jgi:4-hydroxy-tetrahydrodipicolinate synthase|nr:4-hydroxy-tetrahydrodipicolinate synthase [Paludibacteraceae bacterium]MBQ9101364.1 4-hydroxy-tetrahydrodipicolinate synthase [Paludibacteraceae bacterium]MBR6660129.1 4-hydroxy-tetrahydrodipicolinate synthase [Paludibacteraceae bacterium]
MIHTKFTGLGIALITPFNEDESVDYERLGRLVEYQLQNNADYLVVLGTTGETPTLSEEEKTEIVDFVVSKVKGRVPIVLGVGGNNTAAIVKRLQTESFVGIDAILSVVPYYNKPSQEGIYQHYSAIAKASKLPIILYNVPGRTGVNMQVETTIRLAREFDNIIAIKEACGNMDQINDIIKRKPKEFMVLSGDDGIAYPLITMGAQGVISVIGNAFPKEFGRMIRLSLQGEYESAREIHQKFTDLFDLLFVDGNPAGVKCMLSLMGYIDNRLRLPLVPTRMDTYEKIRDVLKSLDVKC